MLPSTFTAKLRMMRRLGEGPGCESILKPSGDCSRRLFLGSISQIWGEFEETPRFTRWESAPIVPRP